MSVFHRVAYNVAGYINVASYIIAHVFTRIRQYLKFDVTLLQINLMFWIVLAPREYKIEKAIEKHFFFTGVIFRGNRTNNH